MIIIQHLQPYAVNIDILMYTMHGNTNLSAGAARVGRWDDDHSTSRPCGVNVKVDWTRIVN